MGDWACCYKDSHTTQLKRLAVATVLALVLDLLWIGVVANRYETALNHSTCMITCTIFIPPPPLYGPPTTQLLQKCTGGLGTYQARWVICPPAFACITSLLAHTPWYAVHVVCERVMFFLRENVCAASW